MMQIAVLAFIETRPGSTLISAGDVGDPAVKHGQAESDDDRGDDARGPKQEGQLPGIGRGRKVAMDDAPAPLRQYD